MKTQNWYFIKTVFVVFLLAAVILGTSYLLK